MKKRIVFVLCVMIFFSTVPSLAEVSRGAKGDEVMQIQQMLVDLGILRGKADGDFGRMTEQAVKDFQASEGLEATGIVDDTTYARLKEKSGQTESETGKSATDTQGAFSITTGLPEERKNVVLCIDLNRDEFDRSPDNPIGIGSADIVYVSNLGKYTAVFHDDFPKRIGNLSPSVSHNTEVFDEYNGVDILYGGDAYYRHHRLGIAAGGAVFEPYKVSKQIWDEWRKETFRSPLRFSERYTVPEGRDATKIQVGTSSEDPYYEWDEIEKKYHRYVKIFSDTNIVPFCDGATNEQVSCDNIIVQDYCYQLDKNGRERPTGIGTNHCEYFMGGKTFSGYCVRNSIKETMSYYDDNGNEVLFNPGKTFIELVGTKDGKSSEYMKLVLDENEAEQRQELTEMPELPDEIKTTLGFDPLPSTPNGLADRQEIAAAINVYNQAEIDPAVLEDLLSSGSATFNDMGIAWNRARLFYEDDEWSSTGFDLTIKTGNDQISITHNQPLGKLSGHPKYDIVLISDEGHSLTTSYDCDGKTRINSKYIFWETTVSEGIPEGYDHVSYSFFANEEGFTSTVILCGTENDYSNTEYWQAIYYEAEKTRSIWYGQTNKVAEDVAVYSKTEPLP